MRYMCPLFFKGTGPLNAAPLSIGNCGLNHPEMPPDYYAATIQKRISANVFLIIVWRLHHLLVHHLLHIRLLESMHQLPCLGGSLEL